MTRQNNGQRLSFKLVSARATGQETSTTKGDDPKLVGEAAEVSVVVNGIPTLCDTGSCVSTVSEQFYRQHLNSVVLQPLSNIIKIECANGETLPYQGFVQVTLQAPGVPNTDKHECLLLVVADTEYNNKVPILLGTNVISDFLNDC